MSEKIDNLLRDLVLTFGKYVAVRKNRDLPHTNEQDECVSVYYRLMNQYNRTGLNSIRSDSSLPHLISEYMSYIPDNEKEMLEYRTLIFSIKLYNSHITPPK